jgi:hypothetical protein
MRRPQDHVLKIDPLAKLLLILLINRLENGQKGLGAPTDLYRAGLVFAVLNAVATTFVFTQECA